MIQIFPKLKHGGGNKGFRCQYFGSLTCGDGVVLMVNSYQEKILPDVIISIAQAYNWENFYKPQKRTLIDVPNDTLQQYTGTYFLGGSTISVFKKDRNLYLSLNGGASIQVYFTSNTDFFVVEIPSNSVKFEKSNTGNNYNIVLRKACKEVMFIKKYATIL